MEMDLLHLIDPQCSRFMWHHILLSATSATRTGQTHHASTPPSGLAWDVAVYGWYHAVFVGNLLWRQGHDICVEYSEGSLLHGISLQQKVSNCQIIGIVIFALFILWEVYSTVSHKVLPPILFTYVRGFDLFCVNMFVTGSFVYAINSYWPVFAQNVYARPGNYTDIGVLGIQQGAGVMTGCLILCFLTKRIKHLRIQLIVAISWQVIWVGCLCTLTPTSKGAAMAFIYLGGIGVSWTIGVCLTSISLAVPHKMIGAATGAANCFRLSGGTIGLAVYSAILASKITPELKAQIIPAANAAGLPPSSDAAALSAAAVFSATAFSKVPGINSTIITAIRYAKAEAYIDVYK
jgi:hypothetical protein